MFGEQTGSGGFRSSWWQRSVTVMAGMGLVVGLVGVGTVSASAAIVDPTLNANQEPQNQASGSATQVLSITFPYAGGNVLTVNGNNHDNGGAVDVWQRTNQWTDQYGSVLQANQLWEFVPKAGNLAQKISTGFGWLRNRESGKCLQLHGSSTFIDGGEINQWDCIDGANNELWTYYPGPNGSAGYLQTLAGGQLALATLYGDDPTTTCDPPTPGAWNGHRLALRSYWTSPSRCHEVLVKTESYAFLTDTHNIDNNWWDDFDDTNTDYRCLSGWNFQPDADATRINWLDVKTVPTNTSYTDHSPTLGGDYIKATYAVVLDDRGQDPAHLTSITYHTKRSFPTELYLFCNPVDQWTKVTGPAIQLTP